MGENMIFQVDSELVKSVYKNQDNFLIKTSSEEQENIQKYCALYFSSNNLYYPNTEEEFTKGIIQKNRFEWFGTRIEKASKHIFLRDVFKQWYLKGINNELNSPEKFLKFLKEATAGYKIITLGSSSGGYAAILYGQLLNAETIYSFNGQFEVDSMLKKSTENVDPILFRNQHDAKLRSFYDINKFIKNPSSVFYFRSIKSDWDVEQYKHAKDLGLNVLSFNTNHHGIPFAKTALPQVLNMKIDALRSFQNRSLSPVFFSLKVAGFKQTFSAALSAGRKLLKRIIG